MANAILRWAFQPARWWQFWRPMSGAPGGLILGSILFWFVMLPALLAIVWWQHG